MSAARGAGAISAAGDAEVVLDALLDPQPPAGVAVPGPGFAPGLAAGDRAIVAPFLGLPEPGQIVLARVVGREALARLVGVDRAGGRRRYRLRSESGASLGRVLREDLIGRVVAVIRRGRPDIEPDAEAARRPRGRRRTPRRGAAAAALLLTLLSLAVPAAASTEAAFAPSPEYIFGPGDVLSLRIWNGEKLDEMRFTVQSDGTALLPIIGIGSLPIGGRTVIDVKQELVRRLGAIYKEIVTELLVLRYAAHRVHLMGEVRTTARSESGPGEWPLTGPTRLVPFLSDHGGATPEADLMRVQIIRSSGERREVNLFRAVFQQSAEDNPDLAAGDLIFLPSQSMGNRKVFVLGEVNSPGVVTILDRLGLVEALARSGGVSPRGYMKGVVVLKRGPEGEVEMHVANLKDMFKKGRLDADIPLQPGDIVFVPRRAIVTLQEVFSIINPALGIIESIYIIDSFRRE